MLPAHAAAFATEWREIDFGMNTADRILATDGDPTACDPASVDPLGDVAALASAALAGPSHIQTFVIGVGQSLANLNQVARAGGTGEAFLTPPGELSALVARAVQAETGRKPVASTSGGTSDARFVKDHCPVIEFGLVGKTMHQVDERVEIAHIHQLKAIYGRILREYFA